MTSPERASTGRGQIDPRGPQFNAMLTSVVLALTLITAPDTVGLVLLGIQTALFAQQMAARAQLEEMRRRALPVGSPSSGPQTNSPYL